MDFLRRVCRTRDARWLIAPRVIAGLPLAGFGSLHLLGDTPMLAILEGAGVPFPGVMQFLAPALMVVGGVSLLAGFGARVGGLLGVGAMAAALYSHVAIEEWPGPVEPPLALPIGVLLGAAVVVVLGAGAWSVDRAITAGSAGSAGPL